MTRIASLAFACALACTTTVLSSPAGADQGQGTTSHGVKLVPPAANTGAVAPSEQASTVVPAKPGGRILRCWQNGRLLFERPGFRAYAARQPNAVKLARTDGDSVVVFDQQDSVCILSMK